MLLHYLSVIFRNLVVDKTYLSINVFGLAVGIASSLVIAQYVQFELGFDEDFRDQDRIYYSYVNVTFPSGVNEVDLECHPAVAPFIIQHIPKVEAAVRIVPIGLESDESTVRRADEGSTFYSRENNLYYADSNVLEFFSVHMLKGNARNALRAPNTVVITEALAEKFFPKENPIDKEIKIRTNYGLKHFRITGVSKTPSPNSSLQYSAFCSLETINVKGVYDNHWQWPLFRTFVKLRDEADAQIVEQNINTALLPLRKGLETVDMKELVRLVPYHDYHFFKPQNIVETMPVRFTGDMRLITLLIVMGGIILVISWINYITLTNARSITRAKEIGLRKVNGATRKSLIFQFLLEFLIINLAALIVGVTLGQSIFPLFATVIGSNAPWIFVTESWFWIASFGFLFFSTFSAGMYPAIFMANYNPSHVLKGNFSTGKKGSLLRKCLVVTQFSFSISLLVSISVIHQQLRFMQTMNLGFETDQVLLIHTTDMDTARDQHLDFQLFKARLEQHKNVKAVSSTDYFLGSRILRGQFFYLKEHPEKKPIPMVTNRVSEGFFDMMKMKLVCGNDFTDGLPENDGKVIITESVARSFGFKDPASALGEWLVIAKVELPFQVIGVVADFNTSPKNVFSNHIFFHHEVPETIKGVNYFIVKLSTTDLAKTTKEINGIWNSLFPNTPFDFFFLDDFFNSYYQQERQFAGISGFFSVIAIAVACMGLFGLSSYNTSRRTKEIGIRKTLGASAGNIVWMFSKTYMNLVLSASVIGVPVCMLLLQEWLKNYPHRVSLEVEMVLIPFGLMMCIALATVGVQTYKSAQADPVKSLRTE